LPSSPGAPGSRPPRGAVVLVWLSRLPRWAVLAPAAVVVVAGLALPGVAGAALLLAVAGLLTWLLATAWPVLTPATRAPRLLTIALVAGYAGWKLLH